jgi:hypothetical protein
MVGKYSEFYVKTKLISYFLSMEYLPAPRRKIRINPIQNKSAFSFSLKGSSA